MRLKEHINLFLGDLGFSKWKNHNKLSNPIENCWKFYNEPSQPRLWSWPKPISHCQRQQQHERNRGIPNPSWNLVGTKSGFWKWLTIFWSMMIADWTLQFLAMRPFWNYIDETELKTEVLRQMCTCFISFSVSFIWLCYLRYFFIIFGSNDFVWIIQNYSKIIWT